MEKIGRCAVYAASLYVLFFVGRLIWDFPLDPQTYWFSFGYSIVAQIIYNWVFSK